MHAVLLAAVSTSPPPPGFAWRTDGRDVLGPTRHASPKAAKRQKPARPRLRDRRRDHARAAVLAHARA
jgi:hypothetical protein